MISFLLIIGFLLEPGDSNFPFESPATPSLAEPTLMIKRRPKMASTPLQRGGVKGVSRIGTKGKTLAGIELPKGTSSDDNSPSQSGNFLKPR